MLEINVRTLFSILFLFISFFLTIIKNQSPVFHPYTNEKLIFNCVLSYGINPSTFEFINCTQYICINQDNNLCLEYRPQFLNQQKCIQSCCQKYFEDDQFTHENLKRCSMKHHYRLSFGEVLMMAWWVIIPMTVIFLGCCYCGFKAWKDSVYQKEEEMKREKQMTEMLIYLHKEEHPNG